MRSLKKAQGITLIGFIFLLVVLGFFAYAAMIVVPVYMNHQGVVKAMKTTASKASSNASPGKIRDLIAKSLHINYVEEVKAKDFKVGRGGSSGRQIQVKYTVEKEFIGNFGFIMKFNESVPLNWLST